MLLVVLAAGCKEEVKKAEPVRPVRVVTVSDGSADISRTFPGKVKATREASLAFRVSVQIVRLTVKEGDFVNKGQLIAMLDQRDYQAAIADLQARLAGARSVLKEAKLNIERNRKLLDQKIIAQSAFDTAQSNYETSRSSVLSLEQSLRRARLNLQYTRLEAPFSGRIAQKIPSNHEFVQAKEPIVQLADTSALDIIIDVPESVWTNAFKVGKTDLDTLAAKFESLQGKLIPVKVKEYQTNANPETQTYEVTLTMGNSKELGVHPGMTAEIIGTMPQHNSGTKVVSVPFSSVVGEAEGAKYVWVMGEGNVVSKREVKVGRIVDDAFLVDHGVLPGETIVVAGVNYLREGQKVKILEGRIGAATNDFGRICY